MSTPPPPPTPPPSNYYAPPARPPSGAGGCWKAAGLTCGVLFLMALVGGIFLVRTVKENMAHPHKGSILGSAFLVVQATQDGQKLQRAIVEYKVAKGHYPKSLLELVSTGRIDGKLLHNELDPSPSPASISWHYARPAAGAPGNTPLLTEHYVLDIPGAKGGAGAGDITITLNGQVVSATGASARRTFGSPPPGP